MDTDIEFLSDATYERNPPYNRERAIELLYAAGLPQAEAIGWTRVGPELLREHLEATPSLVVSEYLARMVGIK